MDFRLYFSTLLIFCYNFFTLVDAASEPFVLFPSAFFWNSTNIIYVTPLLKTRDNVDIEITIEEEESNKLRKVVFSELRSQRPTMKTSTFKVKLPENSVAKRYYVTVSLVGHTKFHAHVNGASDVATIFLQTDKVFYKPEETILIRALPITHNGELYVGSVEFQLLDPNGFRIFNKTLKAESVPTSFIETNFRLPAHVRFGDWQVVAHGENSFRKSEISIHVKEYALPKYHMFLTIEEINETPFIVSATVLARFVNGMQLVGDVYIGCELLSGRSDVVVASADAPTPLRRKLGKGELRDGHWTGKLNITECVRAAVWPTRRQHSGPQTAYVQPSTRLLITAEVHERGTFLANIAAVEYDPLAAGFEIVPLRPAYTQYQKNIAVYLRPLGGVTRPTHQTIQLVAQCVSADTAANGANISLGDHRVGTVVEVKVDLRCSVRFIKGRVQFTDKITGVTYYSREESVVVPAIFRIDFLRFHLIRITDKVADGTMKIEFYDGDTVHAVVQPDRGLNYFVTCNSREIAMAGNVPSDGHISLSVTAATMHGACILYVYGQASVPFADMHLFFVKKNNVCPDDYSMKLSKQKVSVFDTVDVRLKAPAGSLVSLHAYDSRLDALIAQTRQKISAMPSLVETLVQLWTFAEFMSPVLHSDFVFPANLLPMDQLNRRLKETCTEASRQTPQCPSGVEPTSVSYVSDVCMREIIRSCNEQKSPISMLTLKDRQMKAELAIASYIAHNREKNPDPDMQADSPDAYIDKTRNFFDNDKNGKIANAAAQEVALRDFFPEVWLFNSYTIGPIGETSVNMRTPHSITNWQLRAHFWSKGLVQVCHASHSEIFVLKHVFMDVDLPNHVYENETIQVRVTVTVDNIDTTTNLAVCFGGLSPVVCGDVGRNGTLGETDYTRVILSPDQRVQVKKFYVKFLHAGLHNLTFELRKESLLPGGDWHCRDNEAYLYDQIARQVHVDERVDLEEHFRQVIVYQTKRILHQQPVAEVQLIGGTVPRAASARQLSTSDVIQYSQSYNTENDALLTEIQINSLEKVYSMELEFAKFDPSLPPSLASALHNAPASAAQFSPLQNTPQLDTNYILRRGDTKFSKRINPNVYRDRRSTFINKRNTASFSLPAVLRNLAAATYELKPLSEYRVLLADEIERRKYVIGNLLSELLTYSDCVGGVDELCGFGEFGKPRNAEQRNILMSTLATSLLCEQNAAPEFVCGPSRFLANIVRQLNESHQTEIDFGFSTQLRFSSYQEKVLFMQCLLVRMVLDCEMYQCIQEEKSAWQNLHRNFFAFNERHVRDIRLEAALAYVSTPSTRQLMRLRLSNKGNVDRLPFWSVASSRSSAMNLLENRLLKSENVLTNSLALLAYSASRQLYEYWRNQFDFDALAGWLVEQQGAGGHYENAIDTYFGCRALYSYRITQLPSSFEARKIYANISAETINGQRHFTNRELPFSLSIPPTTRQITLTTRGDGRLLVGLRVLSGRRRRSKRDPSENYPVTIRMTQVRNSATNLINQTVTLIAHSAMLKYLEVEHGIFTGFTTQPSFVVIQSESVRFYYEPSISSTAVHFVIENFKKDEPITYTVMLSEPKRSYSPRDLAPIAISAIHHTVVGRLIVLPTSVSFTITDLDASTAMVLRSDNDDNVLEHPPRRGPLHTVHHSRRRNFEIDEATATHRRRRHALYNRQRQHDYFELPQLPQFNDNTDDRSATLLSSGGRSNAELHYRWRRSVRVRQASDDSQPLLLRDHESGLASANLQSSTDQLVETVCLANGVCTCAEMTCQMQCTNCSALTFDSLCSELQRVARFSVIFRIINRNVAEVNRAIYTVFDVHILDWFGSVDAPEEFSIWIRDCNPQCIRLTESTAGAKPRFLLIGDVRGLFSESASSDVDNIDDISFTGGISRLDSTDADAETTRNQRRADTENDYTHTKNRRLTGKRRRVRNSTLRSHYVVHDSDRLARSTDCWQLFGRLQDEQCTASSTKDEL